MPRMELQATMQTWLRSLPSFGSAMVDSYRAADGGASNTTYRVALSNAPVPAVAIRVQSDRGIFEPYDVLREARVLRALAPSTVPVPEVLGEEPDSGILGAPFIVMEWVDAPNMSEARPMASFPAFTEMVARIHTLDWLEFGLDLVGVPDTAADGVRHDLDQWADRIQRFPGADNSELNNALGILRDAVPADGDLSFCHGDINVFNYLFRDQRVASVVDWEQARIGDRRYDIGQLVALSHLKGAPFGPAGEQGFVRAYEQTAGASLANMEYFRAMWLFQLGVIYFGWVEFGGSQPWYSWPDATELLGQAQAEL